MFSRVLGNRADHPVGHIATLRKGGGRMTPSGWVKFTRSVAAGMTGLLLVACCAPAVEPVAAPSKVPEGDSERSTRLPKGWVLYRLPAERFAVALPPEWEAQKKVPKPARFLAFREVAEHPAASASLFVVKEEVQSLEDFLRKRFEPVKNDPDARNVRIRADIRLPAGDAARISFSRKSAEAPGPGEPPELSYTVYAVLRGTAAFQMSFVTDPHHAGEYAELFERIAAHFRFL